MTSSDTLVVMRRFAYPAEAVFDALLDPNAFGAWLCETPDGAMDKAQAEPRGGGSG